MKNGTQERVATVLSVPLKRLARELYEESNAIAEDYAVMGYLPPSVVDVLRQAAGVLKGIGLGAGGHSILPPLLAFNLGVETGQLAIVILILPMLLYLRKTTWFARFGSLGLSALVIAAGVVWFCQRAFA